MNDDLNIPQALAVTQEVLKSKLANKEKLAAVFDFDKVLGLNLADASKPVSLPTEVKALADKRERVRVEENYKESDRLREEIERLGYKIEDIKGGQRITKK